MAAQAERSAYSRKERREAQRTMLKVLDKARADGLLSRGQKFRLGILFRVSPKKCCEALEAAAPEIAELEGKNPSEYGTFDDGTKEYMSEGGLYRLDIGNIEALLQLLIKYLPQIIALIQQLFPADDVSAPADVEIPSNDIGWRDEWRGDYPCDRYLFA